jgi:hypothetical protein
VALFGLTSKIFSAATTPAADTRTWDNLPLYLSFAAIKLSPGQHSATIEFLDQANHVIAPLTKTITFEVVSGGPDKIIFVSDQSVTPQSL